jgi:carbon monoxide dehydrogenase subunit G
LYDICTEIILVAAAYKDRNVTKEISLIHVNRMRHIAATPQAVFAALSDPINLAGLMPRVRRVEMLARQADGARIATRMSIGPFTDIRSEGDVRWQTDREVVFCSRRPVPVEARWTLTPSGSGTDVQVALSLDLAPLIGPFAAFVPQNEVANVVGPDLEAALAEIARRVERTQ